MKILVSFCNQQNIETLSNLILLDTVSEKWKWITLTLPTKGITGLTQDHDFIYVIYQADVHGIAIIKKEGLKIVMEQALPELKDPHSLIIIGNKLYIVSTGTDSVLEYKIDFNTLRLKYVRVLWKPKSSRGEMDTHHLNSIYEYDGEIFISGFGQKKGELWRTANEGYIWNITKNKKVLSNIYHPHSMVVKDNKVYYAESSTRSIKENNNTLIQLKEGYVRGLALEEEYFIIGTSTGRKTSKSTKIVYGFEDNGLLEETCEIQIFDKNNLSKVMSFDFSNQHQEIYDLLLLTGLPEKVITNTTNGLGSQLHFIMDLKNQMEARIDHLNQIINEKESRIQSLQQIINEKDLRIKDLQENSIK